jgi:hypothetical protein
MHRACRIIVLLFAAAYVAALGLLAVGTFGLFGNERDPLAGVFLVPLGLPWNLMLDGAPESTRPWLAAGTPMLNVAILWLICRLTAALRR